MCHDRALPSETGGPPRKGSEAAPPPARGFGRLRGRSGTRPDPAGAGGAASPVPTETPDVPFPRDRPSRFSLPEGVTYRGAAC